MWQYSCSVSLCLPFARLVQLDYSPPSDKLTQFPYGRRIVSRIHAGVGLPTVLIHRGVGPPTVLVLDVQIHQVHIVYASSLGCRNTNWPMHCILMLCSFALLQ